MLNDAKNENSYTLIMNIYVAIRTVDDTYNRRSIHFTQTQCIHRAQADPIV